MAPSSPKRGADKAQIDKFREKARDLGAELDADKFDAVLRKMAHGTPKEAKEATDELADMLGQNEPNKGQGKSK